MTNGLRQIDPTECQPFRMTYAGYSIRNALQFLWNAAHTNYRQQQHQQQGRESFRPCPCFASRAMPAYGIFGEAFHV